MIILYSHAAGTTLGDKCGRSLASTPQGQPSLFREALAVSEDDSDRRKLAYGFNRANFNWYIIDPMFYYNEGATPPNIDKEEQSKPYARAVYEPELFPSKEYQNNLQPTNMSVFNMTFYPTERGIKWELGHKRLFLRTVLRKLVDSLQDKGIHYGLVIVPVKSQILKHTVKILVIAYLVAVNGTVNFTILLV